MLRREGGNEGQCEALPLVWTESKVPVVLRQVFDLAEHAGIQGHPWPIAAVEGRDEDGRLRVSSHAHGAPQEFPELRGDGMVGLRCAVLEALGAEVSFLMAPEYREDVDRVLESLGGEPIYTVVDSGARVAQALRELKETCFRLGSQARGRNRASGLTIQTLGDRFGRSVEGVFRWTQDARRVRELWEQVFPWPPPPAGRFFSEEFLRVLARPLYERSVDPRSLKPGEPFRLEFHPPENTEHNMVPALRPDDFFIVQMGVQDERNAPPFQSIRPLVASLLTSSALLTSWSDRLSTRYPSAWEDWIRVNPALKDRLDQLPLVTVDALTRVAEVWNIALTGPEQALLADFLNGSVPEGESASLEVLLRRLLSQYRQLAHTLGRRVGASNGALMVVNDFDRLDPASAALVRACGDLVESGAPHVLIQPTQAALQRFALQRVLGRAAEDYGIEDRFEGREDGEPLHESEAYFKGLLRAHAELAYLAWSHDRRRVVGEPDPSTPLTDPLVLKPFEGVSLERRTVEAVFVRRVRVVDPEELPSVPADRWVVFHRDQWCEVEPAQAPDDLETDGLPKGFFWIGPRQLQLRFVWQRLQAADQSTPGMVPVQEFDRAVLEAIESGRATARYRFIPNPDQKTGSTPAEHRAWCERLLQDRERLQVKETSTHLEFKGEDGLPYRVRREPMLLSAPQSRFFREVVELAPFPFSPDPQAILTQDVLERIAEWPDRTRRSVEVFEVESALLYGEHGKAPFSSLRRWIRQLLPRSLWEAFYVRSRASFSLGVEVNSLQERLALDFPEDFSRLHREGFEPEELPRLNLITERDLRDQGIPALWGISDEDLPVVIDLLNGRATDEPQFFRLMQHLAQNRLAIVGRLADLEKASSTSRKAEFLVWDVHRQDVDAATREFLKRGVLQGTRLVLAMPYPSDELGVGIDLLESPLHEAQAQFLDLLRSTKKLDEAAFSRLRNWLMMVARHENTHRSAPLIEASMQALLGAFNIRDADAFWQQAAENRLQGKRIPPIAIRYMELYLSVFLEQGKTSVNRGDLEAAVPAWRMVHRTYAYLLAAFQSSAVPFDATDVCEGKILLPRVDEAFAFLGDFCLAGDQVPGFSNPLEAVRLYLDWYARCYGPEAQPVAKTSPIGRYLRMVEAYKAQNYPELIKQADNVLPRTTNMSYLDRLITYLQKANPGSVRHESGGRVRIGRVGFAQIQVVEDRVAPQAAVMAMEAFYRLGRRSGIGQPGFPELLEGYRHFEHQMHLLTGPERRAWHWAYQGALKAEHMEREVIGNIDAAEIHTRRMMELLRDRPRGDPEWVRVQHWFSEAYRGRFEQHWNRMKDAKQNEGKIPLYWARSALEELFKAIYSERELVQRAEQVQADPRLSYKVDEREWFMYRCTELELMLRLMQFLSEFPPDCFQTEGVSVDFDHFLTSVIQFTPEKIRRSRMGGGRPIHSSEAPESWFTMPLIQSLESVHRAAYHYVRGSTHQYRGWYAQHMVQYYDELIAVSPDSQSATLREWRAQWASI